MNLAQLHQATPRRAAVLRSVDRPLPVESRRDPVSTWQRHHLANRAAMASVAAALLAFIGATSFATALADSASASVLAAAALVALAGATVAAVRARALCRRLGYLNQAEEGKPVVRSRPLEGDRPRSRGWT